MPTIKEIAELAGVSATTVSNVLHGNVSHVSSDTLEKVQSILKNQNYVPNMGAMILAHSFSKIVGVILEYTSRNNEMAFMDPFEGELLSSLEENLHKNGYYMMLYVAQETDDVLKLAATWKLDGLIILGVNADDCAQLSACTQTPIVFIDCYFNNDGRTYYNVGLDDVGGSYEMTNYIISCGHRNIAFLNDRSDPVGVDKMRLQGFKNALEDNGIPFTDNNFISLSRDKECRQRILETRIIHSENTYTALFFASDYYAFDAMTVFYDAKIHIPQDFSIAGFDNNIFSKNARPQITTIQQNVYQKGQKAVQMILSLIRKEPIAVNNIQLKTKLIIRNSIAVI